MKKKYFYSIFFNFIFISIYSQNIGLQSFATGFSSPLEITHAGDSRLFIVQKGGLIRILNANGTINPTPFLNVSSLISTSGNERGLLGLAFHPNYATNGLFFINYTNLSGNTIIARYSVSSDPNIANTNGLILMTINQPYSNHNGGTLKFGPDGYLYIGMGDGGSAGDPENRAQNINQNLGKMLRIDVNSNTSPFYSIPPTNPYVNISGNDEIWAIGLRNPWKFSFNRITGDLWIADVGQSAVEEVNRILSPLPNSGLNFGWRCYEGNAVYLNSGCAPASTMVFPFTQYPRSGGACSITGGYTYTGTTYPNFQNKYFYADYCDNRIRIVDAAGNVIISNSFSGNGFATFGEDSNGELYVAGINSGTIFKIIDTTLSNADFDYSNISVIKNSTRGLFTILNATNINSFQIFDVTGKQMFSSFGNNNDEQILDLRSFSNGIYFIKMELNTGLTYQTKIYLN
jgi:glucose/arabinose dehydrogenase